MYFASFERFFSKPRPNLPYLDLRDYGRVLAGAVVKYVGEEARAASALGVRVEVIANGVEVGDAPVRRPRGARVVAGTMARLSPDKKLDQLIDAIASSKEAGTLPADFELRIAGAPERGVEAYARELEVRSIGLPILWVGEQPAETFLRDLDLFAMVSEPSGCPNASLEAMAAGLAVVATDVGGAREQIVDGMTGRLVPRGDTRALGEALVALARDADRREAYGDAGHVRARERFGVARMASDYARVLGLTRD